MREYSGSKVGRAGRKVSAHGFYAASPREDKNEAHVNSPLARAGESALQWLHTPKDR
jgi:hypothetical protein